MKISRHIIKHVKYCSRHKNKIWWHKHWIRFIPNI